MLWITSEPSSWLFYFTSYPGGAHSSAIANQESLSILEVEMRKLEAVTKEILDEMGYLQRREMKMRDTNGASVVLLTLPTHTLLS